MKNYNNIRTLILPDIHGRKFWKAAIDALPKEEYPNINIVFLGDYLDPYENVPGYIEGEGISREEAIENFKEILEYKKSDDRIHLLIGNHDFHYFYDNAHFRARVDEDNFELIKQLYIDNMKLLEVAYEEIVNNQRYLYTHAGVTSFWVSNLRFIGEFCLDQIKEGKLDKNREDFVNLLINIKPTASELNMLLNDFQGKANLWMASWIRGGNANNGSCLWADLEEWAYTNSNIPDTFQIFGHTLWGGGDPDNAVINQETKFAMLDSRKAWVLLNDGTLESF